MSHGKGRAEIPDGLVQLGGLSEGISRRVAAQTNVAEADIYGVGSFFISWLIPILRSEFVRA